ncbi:MAG: DNA polymerase II [Pseudomonadales bacterium]|jgi:DNA polymerase-2|tara:strand:- start:1371 stop:3782 length:2412 start_codon:yes stop_codon:yes gene_type:complete
MKGFVLSRHSQDTDKGINLNYWLATENGPVCLRQTQQEAVCFLPLSQQGQAQKLMQSMALPDTMWRFQSLGLKTFQHEPAVALYMSNHKFFQQVCGLLSEANISLMEQDIQPQERYLMERFISASLVSDAPPINGVLADARVKSCEYTPAIKTVSLDIETTMDGKTIHSIAVYSTENQGMENQSPVQVVWLHWPASMPKENIKDLPQYTQVCANERQLLKQFSQWLLDYNPDAIIGWALVQFDFQILCARARELGVRLRLGRGGEEIRWRAGQGNRPAKLYMPGRVALDGIEVMRSATWQFESFSLENVARQLLGRGKDITKPQDRGEEIQRMYREDPSSLVSYNLGDCRLVWDIFIKANLMAFLIERARLTGLPMDRVGGSSQAFDHLYLPRLHRQGYVAPAFASGQAGDSPGGFVMDSKPGLYRNVLVLDFKSLYPSIIRSFKIDPLGLIQGLHNVGVANNVDKAISGYKGAQFSRNQSILPDIIAELWAARDVAKANKNTPLSTSIKIVMNSCYGVLGSSVCRFYDQRLASSITLRGHAILNQTKDLIQQQGMQVIYGDTDSVFVWLGDEAISLAKVQAKGNELAKELNEWWSHHLKVEFDLKSYLEIEFETYFSRFVMPTIRGQETGSKKRYAGVTVAPDGTSKMLFKGLEQVRTDWTKLAKDLQAQLYQRVFNDEPYLDLIKPLLTQVRSGELDHKLVYRKRLRRPLAEYQKNVPPHVQAARKAEAWRLENQLPSAYANGGWIEYVITLTGPEPLEMAPKNYDYEHYIDRQIEPVVDGILPFLNDSFASITERQLGLF